MNNQIRFAAVVGLWTALAAIGCTPSVAPEEVYKGEVHGRVTLNGQPVPDGSIITFFPSAESNQRAASATIEDDGNFTATGVPVGKVKVTVAPPTIESSELVVEATPKASSTQGFPKKYLSVTTTDAELTVPEGDVEYNLDMH